ncbi:hypothetical protein ACIA49_06415 [Kribbella sp. NPDC051587]|uniref:hypothetical protein n=1 Tax=Kribbella sp. NPDC051587 TaxID=3364119 RepID=UPI0037B0BA3B
MTEADLKDRLSADVRDIEATPELLGRVRAGGARRLRRRRLTQLAVSSVAVAALGATAITGRAFFDQVPDVPAASRITTDQYQFLMGGDTRGNLADDKAYLRQVAAAWKKAQATTYNKQRGVYDHLVGEPRVYWAGDTPGGRAAVIAQYSDLRNHANVQLNYEGIQTVAGFVVDDKNGHPTVVADVYPDGGQLTTGLVATKGANRTLVVLDTGKKTGWSPERIYYDDGTSSRKYTPLRFKDGVSLVNLPADVRLPAVEVHTVPPTGLTDQWLANAGANAGGEPTDRVVTHRLWEDLNGASWPMTDGAEGLAKKAHQTLVQATMRTTDNFYGAADSSWAGYGVSANGSAVYLGEQQLDRDPTRIYAFLRSTAGKTQLVSGPVDRQSGLPVHLKLPDGQGWAVARKDGKLSYRTGGGAWSTPRDNALLVPDGSDVQVRVEAAGTTKLVTLR